MFAILIDFSSSLMPSLRLLPCLRFLITLFLFDMLMLRHDATPPARLSYTRYFLRFTDAASRCLFDATLR